MQDDYENKIDILTDEFENRIDSLEDKLDEAEKKIDVLSILGKDIDHKDRNPRNNSRSNLRVRSKSSNRSRNQ